LFHALDQEDFSKEGASYKYRGFNASRKKKGMGTPKKEGQKERGNRLKERKVRILCGMGVLHSGMHLAS